jgi:preprotein translocase subunit SecG
MQTILTVLHLFLAIGLIALVLMQHGKGADAGAAFGSGASGTVFGASGAGNFLSRSTAILAALFFITSIALGYFSMQKNTGTDLMKDLGQTAPAPTKAVSDKPLDLPQVQLKPVAAGETPDTQSAPLPPADVPQVQSISAPPAPTPIDVPQIPSAKSPPAPTQEEPQATAPKPADPEPAPTPAAEPSVQVEPSAKTEDNNAPQPVPTPVQEEVVGTVIEQTPAASEIKPANTGNETATGSTTETETAPAAPATDAK